jgi:cyclopropane fatty-acyl-phospholipid synthase-like methyltransferase
MQPFTEAESQLLISVAEARQRQQSATLANLSQIAREYFRTFLEDWSKACPILEQRGFLIFSDGTYVLTETGTATAERLAKRRTSMWYWYRDFYRATRTSRAYAELCERLYGRNWAQHGFSDMAQVDQMLHALALIPGQRVLELGCGNGGMAEYIADVTGAHVTGVDYVPEAIWQAKERATRKPGSLTFQVMDISQLEFSEASFDALIAIDTLYFTDIDETVRQMRMLLRLGGQMGLFYSHGAEPWVPYETFPRETLWPDSTPLAVALHKNGLAYRATDFTAAAYQQALRMKQASEDLKPALEAEGNMFLYDSRHGEASGIKAACEAGLQCRYLYHVTPVL